MYTKLNQGKQKRRGAVAAWTAVSMTTLFGFAALAVDGGYLYNVKADLQNAADAAALAAAITMFDEEGLNPDLARRTAVRIAARNLDVSPYTAAHMMDFTIGRYEDPFDHSQSFVAVADNTSNAIRVVLHRTDERGQAVPMFFSAAFGNRTADVSTAAIAGRSSLLSAPLLPLGLRAPGFGPIDPDVYEHNPGKDGPSYPENLEKFQIGEEVTIFTFGDGPRPHVHLGLDLPQFNGVAETNWLISDVYGTLGGTRPDINLSVGDRMPIIGQGTGNGNLGEKLLERMNDGSIENDTFVAPIMGIIPGSRDERGKLAGDVEIVDFAGVRLDRVEERQIPNVKSADPDDTITIRVIIGEIVPVLTHGSLTSNPAGFSDAVFSPILLR